MWYHSFNKLWHWGPLGSLGIIKVIACTTTYCTEILWPKSTVEGFLINICFLSSCGVTLYNFLSCVFIGPGYLPLNWKPKNKDEEQFLQYCNVCQGYKAPRVHHCKTCKRCVLKMDHHCPWINNCVGWSNQINFLLFLAFSVVSTIQSTVILSVLLYHALNKQRYLYYSVNNVPIINFNFFGLSVTVFSLGLSIGVIVGVGLVFISQVIVLVRNRTAIEDWVLQKALNRYRRCKPNETFVFPYDLGIKQNISQVINWSFEPYGDGIHWPVRKECHQYTLTIEQLEQKKDKQERSVIYKVVSPASGSWCPISHGFRTLFHPPCSDEPRIPLQINEIVQVTRWKEYWLYGGKCQNQSFTDEQTKGWFPRKCVIELNNKSNKKEN